ncbi:MAG: response regulator [Wujia sp.]
MSGNNKQCKALVVDDDEINLKVATGLLIKLGLHTDSCINGKRAVIRASKENYDIIFVDHLMPGMDGIETMKAIRAQGGMSASSIMIAITANSTVTSREDYIQMGFDDYLSKPIDKEKLEEIIEKYILSRSEATEETEPDICCLSEEPVVVYLRSNGYDTDAGLSFSGWKLVMYQDLLESFGRKACDSLEWLKEHLNASDIQYYSTLAAKYKNDAKSVGATALYNKLFKHQIAAGAKDLAFLKNDFDKLSELWRKLAEIAINAGHM